ncbi:retrovirus-related pol polyprotein from transposon TNT 1-94 [Tanacetum coccineum]
MPDLVKPKVFAPGMYAIDVEPIPPRNRNNREVHLDYLKHLKESVGTLHEIVEEARVEKPLDRSLVSACIYTKHSQELLEYVIGTCPKAFDKGDRKIATAPLNRKKRVTFVEPVKDVTTASWSKPRTNTKKDRTLPAKSDKKKVEDHFRNNKSSVKQKNRVDSSISYKRTSLKFVKKPHVNKVWRGKPVKQVWQATRKLFTNVGFQWQPTGRKFTLGERCPLTRFIEFNVVPVKQPKSVSPSDIVITERLSNTSQKPLTRDANGVDLIKGNRGTNLYTIFVEDMMKSSLICLLSKVSKNKSWLWHRQLNHLNFGTINDLAQKDLVRGLPRLKFEKDNLCSSCQPGKSQKYSRKPKSKNTNLEVLNTLHMDLCGPMRAQIINGKKYILVIVDDYCRFT